MGYWRQPTALFTSMLLMIARFALAGLDTRSLADSPLSTGCTNFSLYPKRTPKSVNLPPTTPTPGHPRRNGPW